MQTTIPRNTSGKLRAQRRGSTPERQSPSRFAPPAESPDWLLAARDSSEVATSRWALYAPAKRVLDVLLSGLGLVLASPILVVAALLVWLLDGRPILFVQTRIGRYGVEFAMFKVRTMQIDAPAGPERVTDYWDEDIVRPKMRDDPRVTRLGRVLRRLSIDELPQLLNVLRGDMSLVGPRPELPERVRQYESWQFQRLSVPQGVTGWWQVTGRSDRPMHRNTEADIYYVQKRSIGLDLVILLRTVWVVLSGRGAY